MSLRLDLACALEAFPTAPGSAILVVSPPEGLQLDAFGDADLTFVQDMMPGAQHLTAQGFSVVPEVPETGTFDAAIVFVPRAKAAARDAVARTARVAGQLVVDGQKTDGVEPLLKAARARMDVQGVLSKAHGKIFWGPAPDLGDWIETSHLIDGRWTVAPGVFSADAVDPGSALLAAHLPDTLRGCCADLGAGWGFLAASVLERCAGISEMHLVEAQGRALACARQNVRDERAMFHWADATAWRSGDRLDAVIMNPPFHTGRATDLDLGRAFVSAARRLLNKRGALWMVANRHLAYEAHLRACFADVSEIGGDSRFKILQASGTV